jgi:hypothetical protein
MLATQHQCTCLCSYFSLLEGPTEAQLVIIAVLLITGIVGPWIWVVELGAGLNIGFIPFIITIAGTSYTMVGNIVNVVRRPEAEVL